MKCKTKEVAAILFLAGSTLFLNGNDVNAAETPTIDTSMRTLTISVGNGENTYENSRIKIKNKKKFNIKKITLKSKNDYIVMVSKKETIIAQSPGKTNVIVTIKYQNKSTKTKELKKKKISVPVTVKSKYLLDIPQTGMQYDETGKAKPIYPYTRQYDYKGTYSNDASYIDRFPVWVETDYDTDQDGKRDLIMAYVQVPKSATQGYYQAPVLFVANPYLVNDHRPGNETEELMNTLKENSFNYDLLTNSPDPRIPQTEVSTAEVVSGCSAWVNDLGEKGYDTRLLEENGYYITRGYAYVTTPGLGGAKECEGLQCCGERVEAQALGAIVEWLHGDRNGYADQEGTKLLRADWCNGHTAMTGISYLGTLTYEVSTLGVKGLDTVIPCGAIASWYNYIYEQGSVVEVAADYLSWLGDDSAIRYHYGSKKEGKADPLFQTYKNFLFQRNYDEIKANGRYGEYWARYNYSKAKPTVPALLVEGMNDRNVKSNQTFMMKKAFDDSGQECKVLYHQGCHDMLTYYDGASTAEIKVGDEYYDDLINRWMAHYMAGIDNGIDQMKDYTEQSNVDGSWITYDEGRETENLEFRPTGPAEETTIKFNSDKLLSKLNDDHLNLIEGQMKDKSMHTVWEQKIDKDITLSGMVAVHLRAKMPDVNKNAPTVLVRLVDSSDKKFDAFYDDPDYGEGYAATKYNTENLLDMGEGIGDFVEMAFDMKPSKEKEISDGSINLRMPNSGWEPETCTEPSEPTKNDAYYDYTIYLMPKNYTVKAGHKLKLCIMSYGGYGMAYESFWYVDKYTEQAGFSYLKASKYQFTIDNKSSYVELPVLKAS
ncbi:MAG: hypothetical protein J5819_03880 [Eubacterium sp.]|nr:hypothetical protein [Eubacterium sp.]